MGELISVNVLCLPAQPFLTHLASWKNAPLVSQTLERRCWQMVLCQSPSAVQSILKCLLDSVIFALPSISSYGFKMKEHQTLLMFPSLTTKHLIVGAKFAFLEICDHAEIGSVSNMHTQQTQLMCLGRPHHITNYVPPSSYSIDQITKK